MKWFDNIRIRNKLSIIFGVLVFITVSFAVFAVTQFIAIGNHYNDLINTHHVRQMYITNAIANAYRMRIVNLSRGFLLEDDNFKDLVLGMLENYIESASMFKDNLYSYRNNMLSDLHYTEPEKLLRLTIVREIEEVFDRYFEITEKLELALERNDQQRVIQIFEEAIPIGNEFIDKLQEFHDLVSSTASNKAAETMEDTAHTIIIIVLITGAFILLSAFLLVFIVKDIKRPLVKLEKSVTEIFNGNLTYPVRDERRDELGMLSNCIGDMVDKTSENIKANELHLTKLDLVVQASKIGLWDMEVVKEDPVNPSNTFNWSDQFRHMLGFSDEIDFPNILSSWSDRLHPDDKERTVDCFLKHLTDRTGTIPYDVEYRLLMKNGTYRYFHAYGETIRDEKGYAIRVAGALKDITEEKEIALELEKFNKRNEELAHWYKSILDATPLPITVTDANMCWTFVNKAVEDFLGTKLEDMLGKPCSTWNANICNTDDCGIACAKRGLHRTFFTHIGKSYQVDVEKLYNLSGEVAGFIEVVQDITQIEEMHKKQADAEAASVAKSAFLANMSHEIRTPMNAILGITEILLQDETHSPGTIEELQRINHSGNLLLNIINDILDLSKIEAGKMSLVYNDYNVASMINDTVTLNRMRIGSKPIEFELSVSEDLPSVLHGDELRIKQILNNVLSNAIKYTKQGKVKLSVSFEPGPKEMNEIIILFAVSDTGQGMSQEQVSKLFVEYSRFNAEANRAIEGTGLGMTITRNLLFIMKGDIDVKSELGVGSVFTVWMPQKFIGNEVLGKDLAESLQKFQLRSEESTKKASMVYEPMPYGKVLVVDDVESNLFVAKGLMKPYGLPVETVLSGFDAIDKIKEGNVYDIVFMDHMMPKMDGIETVKHIREAGYTQPIVALTANAVVGQSEMFLANGFNGFISKPIDTRELNAVLKKYVRDKQPPEVLEAALQAAAQLAAAQHQKNGKEGRITEEEPLTETWKKIERIEGLQTETGLERFLGQRESYEKTLKLLIKEIEKCDKNLNEFLSANDMHNFAVDVHGMKGSLANIGAMEISELAKELEFAAKDSNTGFCASNMPPFLEKLRSFRQNLVEAFAMEKQNNTPIEIPPELPPILKKLADAVNETDYSAIDKGIESLEKLSQSFGSESKHGALKEELEQIIDAVQMMDYENALRVIQKLS